MSDASITPEQQDEIDKMVKTTKRGFDVKARLRNRGLRRGSITIYLNEEMGPELGWAYDKLDGFGNVVRREREGVIGEIDSAKNAREDLIAQRTARFTAAGEEEDKDAAKALSVYPDMLPLEEKIADLEAKRDELIVELAKTAMHFELRAVPPIIQKDMRRRARQTLEIKEKDIPEGLTEEFNTAEAAHLMTVIIQSVKDNETGEVNTEVTYEDAIDMMGYIPPAQFARLDELMGKIQFTDAISREIESQEDFS